MGHAAAAGGGQGANVVCSKMAWAKIATYSYVEPTQKKCLWGKAVG